MLPRADTRLNPVGRVDPAARTTTVADPRQEAFQRSLSGEVGKSMQGEILSRLTDGSFLVRVAGTAARMALPAGAQVGQQVPLTLVGLNPRPTFEVATDKGTQVTVAYSGDMPDADAPEVAVQKPLSYAAALLAKAPTMGAENLPSIDPKSTPATLSESGRSIATLLGNPGARAPGALVAAAPLTANPATPPTGIAAALQQSLSESGLFYESHVAQWSNGERPLEALTREPQMQRAQSALDAEAARLINHQLNTQEQNRVAWEGQPWPGQPMRWEVSRDAPESQAGGQELEPPWKSGVRLRFPLLGEINASVVLHGGQVRIKIDAGSGDTSTLLRQHAARLTGAMEAAGLALTSLKIRSDEAAADE